MAYITADELMEFTGKVTDKVKAVESYCKAAERAVEKYLGYYPGEKTCTERGFGNGSPYFPVHAMPVTEIVSVTVQGSEADASLFEGVPDDHLIRYADGQSKFPAAMLFTFTFKAGYPDNIVVDDDGNEETVSTVPEDIKLVTLQIASLFWESAGGQLAVTSTSYADLGTRSFTHFTPERFLKQLDRYRVVLL